MEVYLFRYYGVSLSADKWEKHGETIEDNSRRYGLTIQHSGRLDSEPTAYFVAIRESVTRVMDSDIDEDGLPVAGNADWNVRFEKLWNKLEEPFDPSWHVAWQAH